MPPPERVRSHDDEERSPVDCLIEDDPEHSKSSELLTFAAACARLKKPLDYGATSSGVANAVELGISLPVFCETLA